MRYLIIVSLLLSGCGAAPTMITGPAGPQGAQGAAGANGLDGTNGVNGTNGLNGTDGTNGLSIVSAQIMSPQTEICHPSTVDLCYFVGGQRLKYSDGTVYLSGIFRMSHEDTPNTNTYYEEGFHSYIALPNVNSVDMVLTTERFISTNNPRTIFLHWERSPEVLKIVLDTNQSGATDVNDTILATLSLI